MFFSRKTNNFDNLSLELIKNLVLNFETRQYQEYS